MIRDPTRHHVPGVPMAAIGSSLPSTDAASAMTSGASSSSAPAPSTAGAKPKSGVGEETQKDLTLGALARFRAGAQTSARERRQARVPSTAAPKPVVTHPLTVPVRVREEEDGDDIVVTLRKGHWEEAPRAQRSRPPSGESIASPEPVPQNTDPRTAEGAAWLRGEWQKICASLTDPADGPRKEVLDWIINNDFPEKRSRTGQDTYWEHILLRYCGGDFLTLDLDRNYSKDLRWAYIGEWNATGKGHPAIHTSATLLNDKLAGTGYDVYETKFMPVADRLCVTELWGYRDDKFKNNQVTDGVDTFWIEHGEITHKMISLTVTDADGDEREYRKKIGQWTADDEPMRAIAATESTSPSQDAELVTPGAELALATPVADWRGTYRAPLAEAQRRRAARNLQIQRQDRLVEHIRGVDQLKALSSESLATFIGFFLTLGVGRTGLDLPVSEYLKKALTDTVENPVRRTALATGAGMVSGALGAGFGAVAAQSVLIHAGVGAWQTLVAPVEFQKSDPRAVFIDPDPFDEADATRIKLESVYQAEKERIVELRQMLTAKQGNSTQLGNLAGYTAMTGAFWMLHAARVAITGPKLDVMAGQVFATALASGLSAAVGTSALGLRKVLQGETVPDGKGGTRRVPLFRPEQVRAPLHRDIGVFRNKVNAGWNGFTGGRDPSQLLSHFLKQFALLAGTTLFATALVPLVRAGQAAVEDGQPRSKVLEMIAASVIFAFAMAPLLVGFERIAADRAMPPGRHRPGRGDDQPISPQ